MQSIFTRPRARPPLAAVSSQQNMLAVSTEDELLAALTSLPRSDGACYGRGINIVGDITLTGTVTLGSQHSGLLITSSSNARLSTKTAAVTPAFFVKNSANDVTIERLTLPSSFLAATFAQLSNVTNIEVKNIRIIDISSSLVVVSMTLSSVSIIDCIANPQSSLFSSILYTSTGSNVFTVSRNKSFFGGIILLGGSGSIHGNVQLGKIDATGSGGSVVGNIVISGNNMVGDILMKANTGNAVINGNVMNGYSIDTSLSRGKNSIIGNTNTLSVTYSAGDAVTSNT